MIHYKIYTSHKELPDSWDSITGRDIMLTRSYLKALEQASPNNITLYYVGIFKKKDLVGITLVERVRLYLKDMFRKNSASALKAFFRDSISRILRGNILVVGNLTHTGQHGMAFLLKEISLEDYSKTVLKAVGAIEDLIKKETGKTIRLVMLKDFFLNDKINELTNIFQSEKFSRVTVQPNMILLINQNWFKMENYVNSLNKKYKARYKRARKKFGNFEKRELDVETIEHHSKEIHELYSNVSDNAKFNTFFLPGHHFLSLKRELRESFKVFGYFSKDTLIGFYTLILNHDILETYFLGYDSEHQYSNQLYLNMLYDMLDFAIEHRFVSVVYARTAMEIKSSVGAEAQDMVMYMKHTDSFANSLLKWVFNLMRPNQKWERRHPFK